MESFRWWFYLLWSSMVSQHKITNKYHKLVIVNRGLMAAITLINDKYWANLMMASKKNASSVSHHKTNFIGKFNAISLGLNEILYSYGKLTEKNPWVYWWVEGGINGIITVMFFLNGVDFPLIIINVFSWAINGFIMYKKSQWIPLKLKGIHLKSLPSLF